MVGHAMDRGGLKDSENASNSFFPKINRTVFWDLGTDMVPTLDILPGRSHFCSGNSIKCNLEGSGKQSLKVRKSEKYFFLSSIPTNN